MSQPDERPMVELDGRVYPIVASVCGTCRNFWFAVDLPEFAPRRCCYCDQVFLFYEDSRGTLRCLNGQPLD